MGFEVKIDFQGADRLRNMADRFRDLLTSEVAKQTLYFISAVQKTQMTRRRGNIYLNVDTGNLRRSWFPETKIQGSEVTTRAFTDVEYAAIHQYGGTIQRQAREAILSFRRGRNRFVKPSRAQFQQKVAIKAGLAVIPKRLFVLEQFDREMPDRYKKACLKALEGARNG